MTVPEVTRKRWWAKDGKLLLDVYAHNWGFLIPCKSGVIFTQQTGGVSCNQTELEGVFYPLKEPIERNDFGEEPTLLLDLLTHANYEYKATEKIWNRIKEAMHFDFEMVDAPKGMPYTTEGFLWIKLTKFEGGWGHMDWVTDLVGKTLVLIYPNCD